MTEVQGWIIIALLAAIAAALYPLSQQIERFIRIIIHQREQVERALTHADDDNLRFQLKVFLEEANAGAHERTRQRVTDFIERGRRQPPSEARP